MARLSNIQKISVKINCEVILIDIGRDLCKEQGFHWSACGSLFPGNSACLVIQFTKYNSTYQN